MVDLGICMRVTIGSGREEGSMDSVTDRGGGGIKKRQKKEEYKRNEVIESVRVEKWRRAKLERIEGRKEGKAVIIEDNL